LQKQPEHSPVTHPKLKYINQIFGAQMLMIKPNDAISVPAIAVVRHPNLFVRALAIGPVNTHKEFVANGYLLQRYLFKKFDPQPKQKAKRQSNLAEAAPNDPTQ